MNQCRCLPGSFSRQPGYSRGHRSQAQALGHMPLCASHSSLPLARHCLALPERKRFISPWLAALPSCSPGSQQVNQRGFSSSGAWLCLGKPKKAEEEAVGSEDTWETLGQSCQADPGSRLQQEGNRCKAGGSDPRLLSSTQQSVSPARPCPCTQRSIPL